ncbi:DUF924 domain-containing protein [Franconibacter sp. IITDAS19]|uniref:DUF924 family protein n=1 Tax=Franconibacter sp. IITDAS19 TaxID=2930569 RepID=UPI001FF9B887|nr:DUF924 family protein [Franconibacter sp. IITDAS19]MCK1968107.1 DUF924 domain-containing protein [Franconibacter sp. IITDAS19]
MEYDTVLAFWFENTPSSQWFKQDAALDKQIRETFYDTWQAACRGELYPWRESSRGRLAEIIVLDQFSRNLHRESAAAYAQDSMALVLSQEILRQPDWRALNVTEKAFSLIPWTHSESSRIHEQALKLFETLNEPAFSNSERKHKAIIDRFGRYPHRNEALGRESTEAELAFLRDGKGRF